MEAAVLNPVGTNKAELLRGVKARGSLGCRDHEMAEFRTLTEQGRKDMYNHSINTYCSDLGGFESANTNSNKIKLK